MHPFLPAHGIESLGFQDPNLLTSQTMYLDAAVISLVESGTQPVQRTEIVPFVDPLCSATASCGCHNVGTNLARIEAPP